MITENETVTRQLVWWNKEITLSDLSMDENGITGNVCARSGWIVYPDFSKTINEGDKLDKSIHRDIQIFADKIGEKLGCTGTEVIEAIAKSLEDFYREDNSPAE